ncbi:hypothetical protein FVE85_5810 [Porphyridium purpureum]|uniref:Uncharacterized protein n=1 Tax=Porphyridium purpureum TaxID=35688 RepID=A0A5J4Z4G8_PORPP|nr:hypothetical protein FVE85_5810 [Porphyridium purpureum]|eukprot:POR6615..scf295_1
MRSDSAKSVFPVLIPPAVEEQIARGISVKDIIKLLHGPSGKPKKKSSIKRTYDSQAFVNLLISNAQRWPHGTLPDEDANTSQILELIEPYVVAEPAEGLAIEQNPDEIPLECQNDRYKLALSGERRASPAFIVDFVLVGYNLDLLEIRMLETYEYVDVFVVYEGAMTQKGTRKPFYLRDSIATNPERWARFADKMLYVFGSEADLAGSQVADWDFERAPRHLSVAKLKVSGHPLAQKVKAVAADQAHMAFAIQNDEDEIALAHTLKHLKFCTLKPNLHSQRQATVALMPVLFKLNFEWHERSRLQEPKDLVFQHVLREWTEAGVVPSKAFALEYLDVAWDVGPLVEPLHDVLHSWNGLIRTHQAHIMHHFMGPGCGVHISSVNEPVFQLLKTLSVIEANAINSMYPWIFEMARKGMLTPNHLIWSSDPWQSFRGGKHTSLVEKSVRKLIANSIPWAVRYNPNRFPFLLPHAVQGVQSARCILSRGSPVQTAHGFLWHSGGPVNQSTFPKEIWKGSSIEEALERPSALRLEHGASAVEKYLAERLQRAPVQCPDGLSVW